MRGNFKETSELDSCGKIKIFKDLDRSNNISITGDFIKPDDPATPCGLIAKTVFNGLKIYINN